MKKRLAIVLFLIVILFAIVGKAKIIKNDAGNYFLKNNMDDLSETSETIASNNRVPERDSNDGSADEENIDPFILPAPYPFNQQIEYGVINLY